MIDSHIFPELNLVVTTLAGEINDRQIYENVKSLVRALVGSDGMNELTDCRAVTSVEGVTVDGCLRAACLEREQAQAMSGNLALIVRTQLHYGLARAYAAMASENRANVAVCWDLDEAIEAIGLTAQREQILAHVRECASHQVPETTPKEEPE